LYDRAECPGKSRDGSINYPGGGHACQRRLRMATSLPQSMFSAST
jgi:hypothetical protein